MYEQLGDVYTDWMAGVRSAGGLPTNFPPDASSAPANGSFKGRPAARYATAFAPDFGAPDFTTPDGQYEYFLAPFDVQSFIAGGNLVTQGSVDAGAAALKAQWLKDLQAAAKTIAIGGAVIGAVWFLAPIIRARLSRGR